MTWSSEGTFSGNSPYGVRFHIFGGNLYCMAYSADSASGFHRRDAFGNWIQLQIYAGPTYGEGLGTEWNSLLWDWASGVSSGIYRSADGTTWVRDLDVSGTWSTTFGGMGGYGSWMYLAHWADSGGDKIVSFARRSSLGGWVNNVLPAYTIVGGVGGAGGTHAIMSYGGYVFWYYTTPVGGSATLRTTGTAWVVDPILGNVGIKHFIVVSNILFAMTTEGVYRWLGTTWVQETSYLPGGNISVGSDGGLYFCGYSSVSIDAWFYRRVGLSWKLVGKNSGVGLSDGDAATYFAGTYFHGGQPNIYIFSDDFDAHPNREGTKPQAMACDGNGDALYVCLYENAGSNPVAIRVSLPLENFGNGALIYNPAAGDAINVATTPYVGDFAVLSGYFGNNIQTQETADGGATFTKIDPGTWATNRAQPILIDPSNEDRLVVALDGVDDLMEYDGTTWTAKNSALPFDVSCGDMYELNPEEIVLGSKTVGNNILDYSPDGGINLENITADMTVPGALAGVQIL